MTKFNSTTGHLLMSDVHVTDLGTALAFVGTFGENHRSGIHSLELDLSSGTLTSRQLSSIGKNPSYFTIHPNGANLYTVNENENGTVTACKIDRENCRLTRLNKRGTGDAGPCYCSISASGNWLFVAHYDGGTIAVLPITHDGRVEDVADTITHNGSSIHPERQTRPHPHAIVPGPEGRLIYVPDLGVDRVFIYKLDSESGSLQVTDPPSISVTDGSGPRHMTFHRHC